MLDKSPAFQFYPADFLADEKIALMNCEEIGAYWLLVCYCWREGSIPSDIEQLSRLCRMDAKRMTDVWVNVKHCFCIMHDNVNASCITRVTGDASKGTKDTSSGAPGGTPSGTRLVHPRLERERLKQQENRAKRAAIGKKANKIRWKGASTPLSMMDDNVNASCITRVIPNDPSSTSSSTSTSTSIKRDRTFKKPTIEEVQAYCLERKNGVNASTFCDHYESNGWKVGRNSMKDWKACLRNWEKREKEGNNGINKGSFKQVSKTAAREKANYDAIDNWVRSSSDPQGPDGSESDEGTN